MQTNHTCVKHNKVEFSTLEALAAARVIKSGQIIAGPKVKELERLWACTVKSEDAAMVSSGLSALKLALIALGVSDGDEVIVPGYSCSALQISALSIGAKPILADIKDDLTLDPKDVGKRITDKTKAIIAVHTFGAYCDIKSLQKLGVSIVEDMAHGVFLMNGTLCISSFWPTKLIGSTGGGIVAGDKRLVKKVKKYRYYGDQKIV